MILRCIFSVLFGLTFELCKLPLHSTCDSYFSNHSLNRTAFFYSLVVFRFLEPSLGLEFEFALIAAVTSAASIIETRRLFYSSNTKEPLAIPLLGITNAAALSLANFRSQLSFFYRVGDVAYDSFLLFGGGDVENEALLSLAFLSFFFFLLLLRSSRLGDAFYSSFVFEVVRSFCSSFTL